MSDVFTWDINCDQMNAVCHTQHTNKHKHAQTQCKQKLIPPFFYCLVLGPIWAGTKTPLLALVMPKPIYIWISKLSFYTKWEFTNLYICHFAYKTSKVCGIKIVWYFINILTNMKESIHTLSFRFLSFLNSIFALGCVWLQSCMNT